MITEKFENIRHFYKKNRQKIVAGAFSVIWVFSSIMAYFSSSDMVTNTFHSENLPSPPEEPEKPVVAGEIMIGENFDQKKVTRADNTRTKEVWTYNTTEDDVFVRMYIDEAKTTFIFNDVNYPSGSLENLTYSYAQVDRSAKYYDESGNLPDSQTKDANIGDYILLTANYKDSESNVTVNAVQVKIYLANINIDDGATGEQWEFIGDDTFGKFYYTDDLEGITDTANPAYHWEKYKGTDTHYNGKVSDVNSVYVTASKTTNLVSKVEFVSGAEYFTDFNLTIKMDYVSVRDDEESTSAQENCKAVARNTGKFYDNGALGGSYAVTVSYESSPNTELKSINWTSAVSS